MGCIVENIVIPPFILFNTNVLWFVDEDRNIVHTPTNCSSPLSKFFPYASCRASKYVPYD